MYTSFEELKKDCLKCNKCPLAATRTNVVFGVGPEDADEKNLGVKVAMMRKPSRPKSR